MRQDSDGDRGILAVLAAMGGPAFRRLVSSPEMFGDAAVDIALSAAADERVGQFGVPAAHGRAIHEDFSEVLCVVASHWPERFAELVAADPRLQRDGSVLWALGWADCELSAQLLIAAAGARQAGQQYTRWTALMGLDRLASPALSDVLTSLIKDRADLVRSTAVSVAIGHGDARLVSHLHRVATAEATPRGTRAAAWDAIEAIKIREGLADVPEGPHAGRLIPVHRPAGKEPVRVLSLEPVLTFSNAEVHSGQQLATLEVGVGQVCVPAPCSGCIVSNLVAVHRPAPPVLAWIRAHVQP